MLNDFQRVQVLSEALPFIQKFAGRTIVVKYGGSTMQNYCLKDKIVEDIIFLSYIGLKPVVVHGGGPIINSWLDRLNIVSKFNKGVRITDQATMEVVEMVLVGKVNQEIVALINKKSGQAVGLSGKDAGLILASRYFSKENDFAGKVESINADIIHLLINKGYIPIIASVAAGLDGQSYNINADTVAGAIAAKLNAEKLILLTDAPGLMCSKDNSDSLVKVANISKVQALKQSHVISGGMIPKVNCCIQALNQGVKSAHIIDGRVEHALLLEILTRDGIGSMLVA